MLAATLAPTSLMEEPRKWNQEMKGEKPSPDHIVWGGNQAVYKWIHLAVQLHELANFLCFKKAILDQFSHFS